MHELGIMENVLRLAEQQLAAGAGTRIHALTLRVGALSGVVRDALDFAFTALSPGTPAAGARLIVEEVPVACYCAECRDVFEAQPGQYTCPACGRISADVRRGRELSLVNMEIS